MSPGGLNIVFSVLNIAQSPQHRFPAKLCYKNNVFGEKKVCGGPKHRPENFNNVWQNDQNTLKFDQKHHFYATILARKRC